MDLTSGLITIIYDIKANSGGNCSNKTFFHWPFQSAVQGCPFSAPERFVSMCRKQTADLKKRILPCASAWVIGLWQ